MDDLNSELFKAIKEDNETTIKLLLDSGADKDTTHGKGWTPLFIAAKYGHVEIVKLLLDLGADINKEDIFEWTPLMIAAINGHDRIVKLLLDAGADINKAIKLGCTLCCSVFKGHRIIKLLLDSGADINKYDDSDETPLMTATKCSYEKCVKLLLDAGVDINKTDNCGNTPLYIAVEYGNDIITKLLLDATYNDIADKVLIAVSQQDIIFDTAFIIFKKTVKMTIPPPVRSPARAAVLINRFNIDDPDTHNKLYHIFQEKFSKV
jgi:ankyrin repeat protein